MNKMLCPMCFEATCAEPEVCARKLKKWNRSAWLSRYLFIRNNFVIVVLWIITLALSFALGREAVKKQLVDNPDSCIPGQVTTLDGETYLCGEVNWEKAQ